MVEKKGKKDNTVGKAVLIGTVALGAALFGIGKAFFDVPKTTSGKPK